MRRKIVVLLLFFIMISASAHAQFYPTQFRPPHQDWQFLQTPHFKLIYAQGNDSTALQMGRILEQQYPLVQNLVGGELQNFPVVLNDYNDRSNGFVTPLHFRSEIELPPIKGKSLNPQTGNWLKNVGPHELTHALQFSNLGTLNFPSLVNLFSPDLARSVHSMLPSGIIEGLAVHHETKSISPNGGRGNFPIFTNQFDAAFKSNQRWSMGQMVFPPSRTRPFSRYYIGGYEFTAWLQSEFGPRTSKEALKFYLNWPFLGYGVALRHSTGLWPGQLYDTFEEAHSDSLNRFTESSTSEILKIPLSGREIHRPKWLTDSTILFYGSFYNGRPGFYQYDLKTKDLQRLLTTNSVGDYRYDLSRDRSQMVYSFYETNAIYDNTAKAELVRYTFSTDQSQQITKNGRLYAPVFKRDSLWALQTQPASSQLVSVSSNQNIEEIASLGSDEIIAVDYHPETNKLAVVINKGGTQALWISDPQHLQEGLQAKPDISFSKGSIYDPEWHPSGQKLMLSSDASGTHQLYEYDLAEGTLKQITNSSTNAFEGSYSPEGNRIAFIRQVKNERLPAIMDRSDFGALAIQRAVWQATESQNMAMQSPAVSDSMAIQSSNWETGSYSSGLSWLKPRSVLPIIEEVQNQNVYQVGLGLHTNTTLADQSYSAELLYLENHKWVDLTYQNKMFFPGFKLRYYNLPSYRFSDLLGTLLRQERSLALSVPFEVRLNQNVFSTSLFFEPEIRRSQIRFFTKDGINITSEFSNAAAGAFYGQFNFRLQQNYRDLQPNSGAILFSEVEQLVSVNDLSFSNFGNDISILTKRNTALKGGLFTYLSPLRRWNQSLRLGLQGLTQTAPVFSTQSIVSDAFSEPILAGSNNLLSFSSRYTIPLFYVDNGGLLIPFYLSNIYLVAFTNSVADPTLQNWYSDSRSVFGVGIRAQFRFGNLGFSLGVGYGYEVSRNQSQFFVGDF